MVFEPAQHEASTLTLLPHNNQFAPKRVAVPDGETVVIGRLADPAADHPAVPLFASRIVSRRHALLSQHNGKVPTATDPLRCRGTQ